jgi:hypothetical protein
MPKIIISHDDDISPETALSCVQEVVTALCLCCPLPLEGATDGA